LFFYNGEQLDLGHELAIPSGAAEPIRIGQFGSSVDDLDAPNWTSKKRTGAMRGFIPLSA